MEIKIGISFGLGSWGEKIGRYGHGTIGECRKYRKSRTWYYIRVYTVRQLPSSIPSLLVGPVFFAESFLRNPTSGTVRRRIELFATVKLVLALYVLPPSLHSRFHNFYPLFIYKRAIYTKYIMLVQRCAAKTRIHWKILFVIINL